MSINLWTSFKRTWQSTTRRRRATLVGTALAGVAVALIAYASVLTDTFEIDQDAIASNSLPGEDWDVLLQNGGPSGGGAFSFDSDPFNSSADDNFTGGGSKDVRDISSDGITNTFWQNTQTTPPDKDDLEHGFAASYTATNGNLLIYFGADRFSNNGDAAIGFWFFQNAISDNNNSGLFSGVHAVGDILITADFRQGGGVGVINVFKWIGTASGGPLQLLVSKTLAQGQAVPDILCNTAVNGIPADSVCATVNRAPKPVPGNWPNGFNFKGVGATNTFPTGTFFEGGVNISALFPNQTLPCFASFLAMTRTSASTTAQLKDYVLGSFPLCGIEVGKACDLQNPPTVNEDGVSIHTTFKVPITNTGIGTLHSVKLLDTALADPNNLDCKITAIGNTTGLNLPLDDVTPQNVVATLAGNTTVDVVVECNSLDNPMLNSVTATATTGPNGTGTLLDADHETTEAEQCAATVSPSLLLTKDCVLPVTIDPVTLKPHVCVSIVVRNTSQEKLVEGTLIDDKLGTIYGSGGSEGESFSLNPGQTLTLPDPLCYDTFLQDDDTNTLPGDVMFSDTVNANARGAISGELIGDPDDPTKPVPFATAHCPLCPTCPTCDG